MLRATGDGTDNISAIARPAPGEPRAAERCEASSVAVDGGAEAAATSASDGCGGRAGGNWRPGLAPVLILLAFAALAFRRR